MTFQDFNDEGPGTYEWDFVLGQNTTGLFSDEEHFVISESIITDTVFTYAGGTTWNTTCYDSWQLTEKGPLQGGLLSKKYMIVAFDGCKYKAVVNDKFKVKDGIVVDLEEI